MMMMRFGCALALLCCSALTASSVEIEGITITPAAFPRGNVYPPGSPVDVLVGIVNGGDQTFTAREIRGLLSSPDDFSITIKNLTSATLSGGEVRTGLEATFPYTFHFAKAKNMRLRLTLELVYEYMGAQGVAVFHNDTLSWEDSSMLSSAGGIFSIFMTLVLIGGLSFASVNMYTGSQASKRK